jgi:hypothetical protein
LWAALCESAVRICSLFPSCPPLAVLLSSSSYLYSLMLRQQVDSFPAFFLLALSLSLRSLTGYCA